VGFYEEGEDRVVLLEGLEYMMMQNDFNKVLRLVNYLYESVAITRNVLLVSLDPRAFSGKELAFLEKSAIVIDEREKITIADSDDEKI
jgi:hypothetical protein